MTVKRAVYVALLALVLAASFARSGRAVYASRSPGWYSATEEAATPNQTDEVPTRVTMAAWLDDAASETVYSAWMVAERAEYGATG